MFAIIWWANDDEIYPVINGCGTLKVFKTLKEADDYASKRNRSDDCRVISIDGVRE